MRNTVAKRLRKEAALLSRKIGTYSTIHRVYIGIKKYLITNPKTKEKEVKSFNVETVKYSGYRRIYQDLKKAYMRG